jgi:hypothetical protein
MSETYQKDVSISSLAAFLDALIVGKPSPCAAEAKDSAPLQIPVLSLFDSSQVPRISLYDYLKRLGAYTKCDRSLVLALIYIDRVLAADSNFAVTRLNVHRLLLTCTTIAEKYINDVPFVNMHYAAYGGVGLEELNGLEVMLLYILKWRLGVSAQEYNKKLEDVRRSFTEALSASMETEWIVVKEATCETQREAMDEKRSVDFPADVEEKESAEASTQGSTISGSESLSNLSESEDSSSRRSSVATVVVA